MTDGRAVEIPKDNVFRLSPEYESGGAGLCGTAADYILLPDALANGGKAKNGCRLLSEESVKKLEEGILLEDGTQCLPARVKTFEKDGAPYARIEIREGKYHQVKRMTAACGSHVEELQRVRIGALRLDESLAPGECRELTPEELELLFENE